MVAMTEDAVAAVVLKRWRRRSGLAVAVAARELGVSPRMLSYYESGSHPVPRTVQLAVEALEAGLTPSAESMARPGARERWVWLVDAMRSYGRGEPVVGRMLRARDREGLVDLLAFMRRGPDPQLALTDPALFRTLREGCTRAHLAGLGRAVVNERQWRRLEGAAP